MLKQITISEKEICAIEFVVGKLPEGNEIRERLDKVVKRWDKAKQQRSFKNGVTSK